ncbi:MAG: hypothetical protein K0R90_48, partial [Oscillospiraceae bacterium]|nr:hypothetical protein [Oscillospiraceae bacterium]
MKITDIEKNKGTRYTIYVDEEYWYILDIEVISSNGLKVGMECDEEFLQELKRQADVRKARERALYLLSYRDHSKKELIDKLCKSVDEDVAEKTADRMEELGFLDDEKYADKLARDLLERKKLGERRAGFEMRKKGLEKELIESVLEQYRDEIDPTEQIR